MLAEASARVVGGELERRAVAGSAGRHHHMVGGRGEIAEERLKLGRFVGIEGGGALRPDLVRRLGEALAVAPDQDDAGALGTGAPGSLQPIPALPPMTITVWPSRSGSRRTVVACVLMTPPTFTATGQGGRAATTNIASRRRQAGARVNVSEPK